MHYKPIDVGRDRFNTTPIDEKRLAEIEFNAKAGLSASPDIALDLCEALREARAVIADMYDGALKPTREANDKLRAENRRMQEALREITKGMGPFSLDPLEHAGNTIDAMKELARDALAGDPGGETQKENQ